MSDLLAIWLCGTVVVAGIAGMWLAAVAGDVRRYRPSSPDDVEARRILARVVLASPIWPLLVLLAVGCVLQTLVRWAR